MAIDKIKKEKKSTIRIFTPPVISNINYNTSLGVKVVTYRLTDHHYTDDKYVSTSTSEETKKYVLSQSDLDNLKKETLFDSIQEEINNLDIKSIKSKTTILEFACVEGLSNREKKRRAVELCKIILKKQKVRYSIRNQDIKYF